MIKLFKAKSLKKTQETEQSAKVGAGAQGEKNKNAKKQRGRSMVEMLGVLAIIGVLSIGGIQGYTIAMRKYRANEILNLVNKYALLTYANCQTAMNNNPAEYGVMHENTEYTGYDRFQDNFWYCPAIPFVDAGLGPLPTGVHAISDDYTIIGARTGSVTIKSLSSGDAIVVWVQFDTKELCEATQQIIGGGSAGIYLTEACSGKDLHIGFYELAITTMAN